MSRTDKLSDVQTIPNYTAISTPRHIRLDGGLTGGVSRAFDYVRVSHRADTTLYVGVGITASSTAATYTVPPFLTASSRPIFGVHKTAPLEIYTLATGISLQAAGATAVSVSLTFGRF